ncbi:DUF3280 domain-containing protein [Methylobrevis pamukkalensis]|uniref:DUF2380 domain-containing protein n=1 Tax=Methylobrevis pamukkalensis TaxID=1439726 RepID=A0A1E3GWI9_9HYPH|nr:DUF3280 domain-containing protein [Methylobrevis pamukkalensis]ODN68422.1 hypothetical protein A6302_04287 [Methylobrevis pamukkalensis]
MPSSVVRFCLAVLALGLFAGPAVAEEPRKIAILDIELLDTSLGGEMNGGKDKPELARVAMLGDMLRGYYRDLPAYTVVDTPEMRAQGQTHNLQSCGGCDVTIGRAGGADLVMTGVVQKVSNLILSITLYVRSTETGELVQMAGTDIRGNTDESWQHGMRWLARNRLHILPPK